jgi:hypothetical protein
MRPALLSALPDLSGAAPVVRARRSGAGPVLLSLAGAAVLFGAAGSSGALPHRLSLAVADDSGATVVTGRFDRPGAPVMIRFCLAGRAPACGRPRSTATDAEGRYRFETDPDVPSAGRVEVTAAAAGTAPATRSFTYVRPAVLRSFDVRRDGEDVTLDVRFTETGSDRTIRDVELLAEGEGQSWGSQNSYSYDQPADDTSPVRLRIRVVRDTTLRVLSGPFHTGSTGAVFIDAKAATHLTAVAAHRRVTGALTFRTSSGWKALGQRRIAVYFRPARSAKWTRTTTVQTDPFGRYALPIASAGPGDWQARFPQEDDYLAATSS